MVRLQTATALLDNKSDRLLQTLLRRVKEVKANRNRRNIASERVRVSFCFIWRGINHHSRDVSMLNFCTFLASLQHFSVVVHRPSRAVCEMMTYWTGVLRGTLSSRGSTAPQPSLRMYITIPPSATGRTVTEHRSHHRHHNHRYQQQQHHQSITTQTRRFVWMSHLLYRFCILRDDGTSWKSNV